MQATALIIDDEPDIRELVAMSLSRIGVDCHTAGNLAEARNLLDAYPFDVCLTDMRLPDGNGVEFVRYLQEHYPALPVAVLTAHGNMQAAVEAMKNGAYDFVSKPVDIGLLRRLVLQAVDTGTSNARNSKAANDETATAEVPMDTLATSEPKPQLAPRADLKQSNGALEPASQAVDQPASLSSLSGRRGTHADPQNPQPVQHPLNGGERLIGQSARMQNLRNLIAKVARTNAPVWITGESGTGKELIAQLIHQNGARAKSPFVAINCGAIPTELVESELFGHRKGSFTGATTDRDGLFSQADGGTLFLDEVADLPLHTQVKLLRAIQERCVRPVGASEEVLVNVRLLSASHGDLAAAVEAGSFRHDLYFRLNVIALKAPPLRERIEDIPDLAQYVLRRLNHSLPENQTITLNPAAISALQKHPFPGNVRELENMLERAVALSDTRVLDVCDLQIEKAGPGQHPIETSTTKNAVIAPDVRERERLLAALEDHRWNRKAAAASLGLTYRQIRYRLKQLGLDGTPPDDRMI